MSWSIDVFGVRHLSPMGAWHLVQFLDEKQPDLILIEGLDDATDFIFDICRPETRPPIAILAYTSDLPVRTIVYPFATYSPEYQAIKWGHDHNVTVEFFDLPSSIFLGLYDREQQRMEAAIARRIKERSSAPETTNGGDDTNSCKTDDEASLNHDEPTVSAEQTGTSTHTPEPPRSLYMQIAERSGERDYETYWERNFEHTLSQGTYRRTAWQLGESIRDLEDDSPTWRAENLVREAYMRRRIAQCIANGIKPEKIVAVVGAFHASVLNGQHPAMSDAELALLPRRESKLTLMPYSYYKLSSQSGYGAGNHAPAYYELLWRTLVEQQATSDLSRRYVTCVAREMRSSGTHRSTAEVIEAVRLAETLSAFKEGTAPTLRDLRDAVITLLGQGEPAVVRESLAKVDIGTDIGQLPKGVSQTSIQEDFDRELRRLKLEKFRKTIAETLDLDLRENRRVQSREAALLDLHRSSFLHRLRVLRIPFVAQEVTRQDHATWAERWRLQWSPESEIALVEAVLLGETVELATAYRIKSMLEECERIPDASALVADCCQCGLIDSMNLARQRLQELAVLSRDFAELAFAVHNLSIAVRYGDVRQVDASRLLPLLQDLFSQAALNLVASSNCDDRAAPLLTQAIDLMNRVALELHDVIEEDLWIRELRKLTDADDRNPILSGYGCGLLLERGAMDAVDLSREVARRLSPGIAADLGAGWFEGLAKRNRYSLLARQSLWEQLARYVAELEDSQFRRAVVFLRRAFGSFSAREKRTIAENLGELWGMHAETTADLLEKPLTESEEKKLAELDEFGFDDL